MTSATAKNQGEPRGAPVHERRRTNEGKRRGPRGAAPNSEMSSPDRVVQAITYNIQAGRYGPGHRLVESELTRQLKVSRGSVREAFKRLAAEGIVVLRRNRGACVNAMSRQEVHDTLVMLEALTGLAARLAATRIHEGESAEHMRAAYQRIAAFRERGGTIAFFDERRRFYDTLIEIGGNKAIGRSLPVIQIQLLRMQFQAFMRPRDWDRQFEDYRAITDAVLAGNAQRAERLMRIHIRRTRIHSDWLPDEAFGSPESA